jgi:hypothetical protein
VPFGLVTLLYLVAEWKGLQEGKQAEEKSRKRAGKRGLENHPSLNRNTKGLGRNERNSNKKFTRIYRDFDVMTMGGKSLLFAIELPYS